MRRIVLNTLLVVMLVPAMIQSGMAKWTPRLCGGVAHGVGWHPAYHGQARESHAHHDQGIVTGKALDGNDAHCHLTGIACGCFDAHDLTLLFADPTACLSELNVYENLAIASVASIVLIPPTPPPRS